MIPGVEVVEKDAIKRLVGQELVSSYPEVFEGGVKRDLNFHILMQAIHRNQKDVEALLQVASRAVWEMK